MYLSADPVYTAYTPNKNMNHIRVSQKYASSLLQYVNTINPYVSAYPGVLLKKKDNNPGG